MITPQDIREKTFEKAVFGGYDMATVDQFLETVANDLGLMQQENATLKAKMKVLVDKISEYRDNEDALRMAVVSAQKLGNDIEREARQKADVILNEARAEAEHITKGAGAELKAEETRLAETKKISAEFIESMEKLCQRQMEFLERVSKMDFVKERRAAQAQPEAKAVPAAPQAVPVQPAAPVPQPAAPAPRAAAPILQPVPAARAAAEPPEIHETVKSIEETVARVMDEPVINLRPELQRAVVEDERPTRSFNIVTDPEDDIEKTNQFSLEDFAK